LAGPRPKVGFAPQHHEFALSTGRLPCPGRRWKKKSRSSKSFRSKLSPGPPSSRRRLKTVKLLPTRGAIFSSSSWWNGTAPRATSASGSCAVSSSSAARLAQPSRTTRTTSSSPVRTTADMLFAVQQLGADAGRAGRRGQRQNQSGAAFAHRGLVSDRPLAEVIKALGI